LIRNPAAPDTHLGMASPSSVSGFAGAAALAASPLCIGHERLPEFKRIYDEHMPFMWRAAHHLGVAPGAIDDVLQEVFIVVHRRLPAFEGRSSLRTWMYGILLHVVRNHRRALRKRRAEGLDEELELSAAETADPHDAAEAAEAMRLVETLLDDLDDDRREVFVLVELEQLTVPEIAVLLGEKVNTIYGRLRVARQQFEMALRRHRARERRLP
jgi:RNA polymerase sigma-70 factor, ECF subfamily